MPTPVGTKAGKKQSSLSETKALSASDREFENSLLALENACLSILEGRVAGKKADTEGRQWQQRLINIANPVSLALMEYKGPRHFHYHYRHRKDDEAILHPVLENPIDMLAKVCKVALRACQNKLAGLQDEDMIDARYMLEGALRGFMLRYKQHRRKIRS